MRMETVAMSRGYRERTKMTPMMYQMTPFVLFCRKDAPVSNRRQQTRKKDAHFFALAHQEAQDALEQPLEAARVEADDVCGDDNEERKTEGVHNGARVAVARPQVPSEEA